MLVFLILLIISVTEAQVCKNKYNGCNEWADFCPGVSATEDFDFWIVDNCAELCGFCEDLSRVCVPLDEMVTAYCASTAQYKALSMSQDCTQWGLGESEDHELSTQTSAHLDCMGKLATDDEQLCYVYTPEYDLCPNTVVCEFKMLGGAVQFSYNGEDIEYSSGFEKSFVGFDEVSQGVLTASFNAPGIGCDEGAFIMKCNSLSPLSVWTNFISDFNIIQATAGIHVDYTSNTYDSVHWATPCYADTVLSLPTATGKPTYAETLWFDATPADEFTFRIAPDSFLEVGTGGCLSSVPEQPLSECSKPDVFSCAFWCSKYSTCNGYAVGEGGCVLYGLTESQCAEEWNNHIPGAALSANVIGGSNVTAPDADLLTCWVKKAQVTCNLLGDGVNILSAYYNNQKLTIAGDEYQTVTFTETKSATLAIQAQANDNPGCHQSPLQVFCTDASTGAPASSFHGVMSSTEDVWKSTVADEDLDDDWYTNNYLDYEWAEPCINGNDGFWDASGETDMVVRAKGHVSCELVTAPHLTAVADVWELINVDSPVESWEECSIFASQAGRPFAGYRYLEKQCWGCIEGCGQIGTENYVMNLTMCVTDYNYVTHSTCCTPRPTLSPTLSPSMLPPLESTVSPPPIVPTTTGAPTEGPETTDCSSTCDATTCLKVSDCQTISDTVCDDPSSECVNTCDTERVCDDNSFCDYQHIEFGFCTQCTSNEDCGDLYWIGESDCKIKCTSSPTTSTPTVTETDDPATTGDIAIIDPVDGSTDNQDDSLTIIILVSIFTLCLFIAFISYTYKTDKFEEDHHGYIYEDEKRRPERGRSSSMSSDERQYGSGHMAGSGPKRGPYPTTNGTVDIEDDYRGGGYMDDTHLHPHIQNTKYESVDYSTTTVESEHIRPEEYNTYANQHYTNPYYQDEYTHHNQPPSYDDTSSWQVNNQYYPVDSSFEPHQDHHYLTGGGHPSGYPQPSDYQYPPPVQYEHHDTTTYENFHGPETYTTTNTNDFETTYTTTTVGTDPFHTTYTTTTAGSESHPFLDTTYEEHPAIYEDEVHHFGPSPETLESPIMSYPTDSTYFANKMDSQVYVNSYDSSPYEKGKFIVGSKYEDERDNALETSEQGSIRHSESEKTHSTTSTESAGSASTETETEPEAEKSENAEKSEHAEEPQTTKSASNNTDTEMIEKEEENDPTPKRRPETTSLGLDPSLGPLELDDNSQHNSRHNSRNKSALSHKKSVSQVEFSYASFEDDDFRDNRGSRGKSNHSIGTLGTNYTNVSHTNDERNHYSEDEQFKNKSDYGSEEDDHFEVDSEQFHPRKYDHEDYHENEMEDTVSYLDDTLNSSMLRTPYYQPKKRKDDDTIYTEDEQILYQNDRTPLFAKEDSDFENHASNVPATDQE